MNMLPKHVFKNTIALTHVALEHNQPTPITKFVKVYIFIYEAIFVSVQFQVVKTTQYTTSNLIVLKTKHPNPYLNPNALKYTIYQKHCHNLCIKSYPKTI